MSRPSIIVPIVFGILFFINTVVVATFTFRRRAFYLWTLVLAGLLLCSGQAAFLAWLAGGEKYDSSDDVDSYAWSGALGAWFRLNVLGSLFLTLAIYTTYARLIHAAVPRAALTAKHLWFPPRAGPLLLATALGVGVGLQCVWYSGFYTFIGLVWQSAWQLYFLVVTIRFRRIARAHPAPAGDVVNGGRGGGGGGPWARALAALIGLAALVLLRSVLGWALLLAGVEASTGKIYVCDALPLLLCFSFFMYAFPGAYLPQSCTGVTFDGREDKRRTDAEARVEELRRETGVADCPPVYGTDGERRVALPPPGYAPIRGDVQV